MLWNYHDDDLKANDSPVELTIKAIPSKKVKVSEYRIDAEHSNSYEVWKKMGSPQQPTAEQIATLEKAGKLELLAPSTEQKVSNGTLTLNINLPRQAVSLIKLTWE
jgi:xylan 1,4-beta-xylosidase